MDHRIALLLGSLLCLLQVHLAVSQWSSDAMGTFYGGGDASGTWGGHCGFGQAKLPTEGNIPLTQTGYGTLVSAASAPLWKDGAGCGACYEVRCARHAMCKYGASVVVTITDECPGACWADNGAPHFDLSEPAFNVIADKGAGAVPLEYQRVPCQQRSGGLSGGVKVAIRGSDYYLGIMVWNVAGRGSVAKLEAGDVDGNWVTLDRDWGAWFKFSGYVKGSSGLKLRVTDDQGLSFVTSGCSIYPSGDGAWYECSGNFGDSGGGAVSQVQPPVIQTNRRRKRNPNIRKNRKGGHHPKGKGMRGKKGMRKIKH